MQLHFFFRQRTSKIKMAQDTGQFAFVCIHTMYIRSDYKKDKENKELELKCRRHRKLPFASEFPIPFLVEGRMMEVEEEEVELYIFCIFFQELLHTNGNFLQVRHFLIPFIISLLFWWFFVKLVGTEYSAKRTHIMKFNVGEGWRGPLFGKQNQKQFV
jgi:hypothetical protein